MTRNEMRTRLGTELGKSSRFSLAQQHRLQLSTHIWSGIKSTTEKIPELPSRVRLRLRTSTKHKLSTMASIGTTSTRATRIITSTRYAASSPSQHPTRGLPSKFAQRPCLCPSRSLHVLSCVEPKGLRHFYRASIEVVPRCRQVERSSFQGKPGSLLHGSTSVMHPRTSQRRSRKSIRSHLPRSSKWAP